MAEEFGLERAGEFPLLVSFVVVFAFVSAILSLLIVVLCVLALFFRNNRFIAGYLSRWHPWKWRRVTLSAGTQKRQSLAWKIQSLAFGDSAGNRGIDWAQEVERGTLGTKRANQLSRIADRETQAWLVGNLATKGRFVTEDRREWLFQVLVTCLLYTSPSPRDQRGSRMPSSA